MTRFEYALREGGIPAHLGVDVVERFHLASYHPCIGPNTMAHVDLKAVGRSSAEHALLSTALAFEPVPPRRVALMMSTPGSRACIDPERTLSPAASPPSSTTKKSRAYPAARADGRYRRRHRAGRWATSGWATGSGSNSRLAGAPVGRAMPGCSRRDWDRCGRGRLRGRTCRSEQAQGGEADVQIVQLIARQQCLRFRSDSWKLVDRSDTPVSQLSGCRIECAVARHHRSAAPGLSCLQPGGVLNPLGPEQRLSGKMRRR